MAYLADDSHGLWARVAAAQSLSDVGERHPEARDDCVAILSGQLGLFAQQDSGTERLVGGLPAGPEGRGSGGRDGDGL